MPTFAESEPDRFKWITSYDRKFYPDHFDVALSYYQRHIDRFRELAEKASDSVRLYRDIMKATEPDRTQMLRIFTRYVSPKTSVEMLKRVGKMDETIRNFRKEFRTIRLVREWINRRDYDPMLAAIMWEYKDRGKVGYDLTEEFFDWFENRFPPPTWEALGKRRGGAGHRTQYGRSRIPPRVRYRHPHQLPRESRRCRLRAL